MKELEKGIYPVDNGSMYGDVLYGYTDIDEAKRDYIKLTGEELDLDNLQGANVVTNEDERGNLFFSWETDEGVPSLICVY